MIDLYIYHNINNLLHIDHLKVKKTYYINISGGYIYFNNNHLDIINKTLQQKQ